MSKTNVVTQVGGMPQQMSDVWSKYSPPVQTFVLLVLFLGIVFYTKLHGSLLAFSDTLIGRGIALGAVYFVTQQYGWTMGILVALLAALVISTGSHRRLPINEGFNSDMKIVEKGPKWFVEKVLGENPLLIEEENIYTQPVQDLSRKNDNSYGGSVQNTSVST